MHTPLRGRCAVLFFLAAACLAARPLHADPASLTVDVSKPGVKISPMLYGLFFEEINHAGDGGIYGEMIRNRSFEEGDTPEGWSLVQEGGAEATVALDTAQPLNEQNPRSLRLEVRSAKGRAGVANSGYWGIGVKKGKRYELSFYARRSPEAGGTLLVGLEGEKNRRYATAAIAGVQSGWQRFTCTLTARESDPAARLVIAPVGAGTFWLDTVSLFPRDTYKGRPNGLRADLAGMLAEMRPGFVRFPGGCYVEGDRLQNAFRWKDSLGDIAARPGHWNLWGYRSTDGLGLHEYLQLCEDIGAAPLYVINCGMSHRGNVPMDQMKEWVQDALDVLEYADGPVTTKWGALRAKAGHPAPFNLKHMEIGNENGGPAYDERYALFYDAIKKQYPDVQLVANVWGGTPQSKPTEVVDEHYYNSPEFFLSQATRYDSYSRTGPKVYVGEYACTRGCGKGNLIAALGEAAFMTGMERNSDVVVMASYAPLFVNVHDRKWNPDAIVFNSAQAYGTPSYWVQQMFGSNRGDVVLPATLTAQTTAAAPQATGAIGLGTWLTQAEYKDVKVTRGAQTLFSADFASGAPGWRVFKGDWKATEGVYRQSSGADDVRSLAGDPSWGDYTLTLKARKLGGAEGFLIMFRVKDDDNWIWWNIGGWGNKRHALEKCTGGGKSELGRSVNGSVETGRWYDIKVELAGARIRCYLDGKLIHDVQDRQAAGVAATASRVAATGEILVKVVNCSGQAQETDVTLTGVQQVEPRGTALVLTGQPNDENSFEAPKKVAPVTRVVRGLGPKFRYTFPPYSLTILRVKGR